MKNLEKRLLYTGIAATLAWLRSQRHQRGFRGQAVLITGGSRGLGLLLARTFAAQGARLVLVARDEAELMRAQRQITERQQADVTWVVGDVADEDTAQRAVETALQTYGRLDVLVNNAGVIQAGPFANMRRHDYEEALEVHFWGAYQMTMAALPQLRRSKHGRIVNITSIGGKIAVPHLLPYSVSKFALVGFSDGIRAELAHEGVKVTTVIPGLMRTGSHMNALFKGQHRKEFSWFAISDSLPITSIAGERAARQIVEACRKGVPQLVITWQAQTAILAQALAPGLTARLAKVAARLLPAAPEHGGETAHTGWESQSLLAPSWLTAKADQATIANNEMPLRGKRFRK